MITTRRLPREASTARADGSGDAVVVVRRVRDVCAAVSSAAAAQVTGRSA